MGLLSKYSAQRLLDSVAGWMETRCEGEKVMANTAEYCVQLRKDAIALEDTIEG